MWITPNTRYTSSRVWAAVCSPTSSAAKRPRFARSKSSNTRKASSPCDSPDSPSGMMSQPSAPTIPNAPKCSSCFVPSLPILSLPEGFRAKIFLAQEKAREYAEQEAVSGLNTRVSFAKYDHATCSWKTPQCFALEGLDEFSETWPRWGMMLHGACYQLKAWEPGISATEYGLLPTPTVNGNNNRAGISPKAGDGLNTAVRKMEKWPTPCAVGDLHYRLCGDSQASKSLAACVLTYPTPQSRDATGCSPNEKPRDKLCFAIERGKTKTHTYPTPNIDSMCGGSGSYAQIMANPDLSDDEKRSMISGNGGRLNPDWVEWLMFMPVGWTDIETPNHRLIWLHPSHDPANLVFCGATFISRLTTRRTNCANRIKGIGNAQYCATTFVAFYWGLCVLNVKSKRLS